MRVNDKAAADAAAIVRDAGGKLVGRTRFQKLGYVLKSAGLGSDFDFEYRLYGPYSEELNTSADNARSLGLLREEMKTANWGGKYSVFQSTMKPEREVPKARKELAQIARDADPIELELAATALFLYHNKFKHDPWGETARRKPEKADKLPNAKLLYEKLRRVNTPKTLPAL